MKHWVEQMQYNKCCTNPEDLRPAWAHLHIHQGDFKRALEYLQHVGLPARRSPKVLNNIAFCLEQLGNLRLAKETQMTALNLATTTGYAAIRVISLGNLACIEGKLGNFIESRRLFTVAFEMLTDFTARDKHFSGTNLCCAACRRRATFHCHQRLQSGETISKEDIP